MRWYSNIDIPMRGEPVICKTEDKNDRVYVGCIQIAQNFNKFYHNEDKWLLTISQDKIEWSKIKKWQYVQRVVKNM